MNPSAHPKPLNLYSKFIIITSDIFVKLTFTIGDVASTTPCSTLAYISLIIVQLILLYHRKILNHILNLQVTAYI